MGKKSRGRNNDKRKNKKAEPKAPQTPSAPSVSEAATTATKSTNTNSTVAHITEGSILNQFEPGRIARIQNLKGRTELNGSYVTIKGLLPNRRIAVEITDIMTVSLHRNETVSIKAENLVSMEIGDCVEELEECPICMDTMVNVTFGPDGNGGRFACCGKKMCNKCLFKMKSGKCPFCNSEKLDGSSRWDCILARAERGDVSAMFDLANSYHFGSGADKDGAKARVWYEKAALKGHAAAAHNVACMLKKGDGVPMNIEEAAKWFGVASDLGGKDSKFSLARMYLEGCGVPQDIDVAMKLLEESRDAGCKQAEQVLEYLETF